MSFESIENIFDISIYKKKKNTLMSYKIYLFYILREKEKNYGIMQN